MCYSLASGLQVASEDLTRAARGLKQEKSSLENTNETATRSQSEDALPSNTTETPDSRLETAAPFTSFFSNESDTLLPGPGQAFPSPTPPTLLPLERCARSAVLDSFSAAAAAAATAQDREPTELGASAGTPALQKRAPIH